MTKGTRKKGEKMMLSLTNLGKNLRKFRTNRKMNLQHIADNAHSSPGTISLWEQGKRNPNLYAILTLCDTMNTSVEELFQLPTTPTVMRILNNALRQKDIEYVLDADSLLQVLRYLLSPSRKSVTIRISCDVIEP
jgi:transcriptional regulator with XRE-family HTH domain